jgi:hypothetical protein
MRCVSRTGAVILRRVRTTVLMVLVVGMMRMRGMRARGADVNRYCVMVMNGCRHCGGKRLPRQHQSQQHYRDLAYAH